MKLNINDFKKVKEDKNMITLAHPRHGHQLNIAKNSLSKKMKSDFAAMPLHNYADGGEVSEEQKDPSILDQISNYFTQPAQSEAAPEQMIDPETRTKREMYNRAESAKQAIMPTEGLLSPLSYGFGHQSQQKQDFLFGPNGEAPKQIDPDVAGPVNNLYNAEKAHAQITDQAATKAAYEKAIKDNETKQALGLPADPLPQQPIPPMAPDYQRTGMNPNQEISQSPAQMNEMAQANDTAMGNYMKGYQEQRAGIGQEAKAQGQLGEAQAAIAQEQIQQQQNFMKHAQDSYNELNQERQGLVSDVKNNLINPNHYMENMSAVGKAGTMIGMLLSGMGSGVTGQPNMAMDILNKQIDRDIQSQMTNLNQRDTLLKANLQQFGNMRDALNMTRIMQNDIYKAKIEEQAAKSQNPILQAKAQQLMGQLDMQMAPLMQQMSLRQAAFKGMKHGNVDPSMIIQYVAPEKDREHLMKDLGDMNELTKTKDNIMSAFDQVNSLMHSPERLTHPIDTQRKIDAIKGAVIPGLSKSTAGRFTEQDSQFIDKIFPSTLEGAGATKTNRQQLDKLTSEKMNFPALEPYGIRPKSKYKDMSQFNLNAPVAPRK